VYMAVLCYAQHLGLTRTPFYISTSIYLSDHWSSSRCFSRCSCKWVSSFFPWRLDCAYGCTIRCVTSLSLYFSISASLNLSEYWPPSFLFQSVLLQMGLKLLSVEVRLRVWLYWSMCYLSISISASPHLFTCLITGLRFAPLCFFSRCSCKWVSSSSRWRKLDCVHGCTMLCSTSRFNLNPLLHIYIYTPI